MKTIVITGVGAPNSLGTIVARKFRAAPQKVKLIGILGPEIGLDAMADLDFLDSYYTCDLSNLNAVRFVFETISNVYKKIDCLINCAGMNKMNWFEDIYFNDFQKVMDVNFTAPLMITQYLLPSLAEAKGTVLNIISMGAHKPFRTSLAYNCSKAALKMATAQLARELTPKFDITVFGISPNELKGTGMTLENADEICRIRGWTPEQAELYRQAGSVYKEQTDPEKLAEFIVFLLKDKSNHAHLTGVDLYYGD